MIYPKIRHQVNGKEQIDLLLDYAKWKKGIPAYMFYNYCYDLEANFSLISATNLDADCFGCTIANANCIKDLCFNKDTKSGFSAPAFIDMHPKYAIPIQYLVPSRILIEYLEDILNAGGTNLSIYTKEQVIDRQQWKETISRGAYGEPTQTAMINHTEKLFTQNDPHKFNPRFRIVLSKQIIRNGT